MSIYLLGERRHQKKVELFFLCYAKIQGHGFCGFFFTSLLRKLLSLFLLARHLVMQSTAENLLNSL